MLTSAVDRQSRLLRLADGLAVAVAVSLPWSITATGILVVLWLIAALSILDRASLRQTLVFPAALLPLAFCALAAAGIFWATADWADRFGDFKVFLRLLVIILLLVQFQRSSRGSWVLIGFLISCSALMGLSWLQWFFPALDLRGSMPGVPVKDYIIQSGEFLICAFALLHLSVDGWSRARRWQAIMLGFLALLFLANIAFVAAARSVLVIFAVLVIVFGLQRFGWRGAVGIIVVAATFSSVAWTLSPYLRARVIGTLTEIQDYRHKQAETSAGYRLDFWRRSIEIVSRAPILGHGTGSLYEQFRQVVEPGKGIAAVVTNNPHNQTLTVAIQLGLVGVALLYAMWIAHLMLFHGSGLPAWLGSGVVIHNIGAGLFNAQLFEATLGWVYIFGVGVLGGMLLRARREQAGKPQA